MQTTISTIPFVMHAFPETVRINLCDDWYDLPPLEPVEIPQGQFHANQLVDQYGPIFGIVLVPTTRGRSGITINIEEAEKLAKDKLDEIEKVLLHGWVRRMLDERVKDGKPVLPPSGRVADIIRTRNIDLKAQFGLVVTGDGFGPSVSHQSESDRVRAENDDLRRQLAAATLQNDRLAQLEERFAALLGTTAAPVKETVKK